MLMRDGCSLAGRAVDEIGTDRRGVHRRDADALLAAAYQEARKPWEGGTVCATCGAPSRKTVEPGPGKHGEARPVDVHRHADGKVYKAERADRNGR